jgi:hypothetical protein
MDAAVNEKFAVEKDPLTTLNPALLPRLVALPSVHPQPAPLIRMTSVFAVSATPLVVNNLSAVALKEI